MRKKKLKSEFATKFTKAVCDLSKKGGVLFEGASDAVWRWSLCARFTMYAASLMHRLLSDVRSQLVPQQHHASAIFSPYCESW